MLYPVLTFLLIFFLLVTQLVNKTPRWNESLGAFCLNFQVYVMLLPTGRRGERERAREKERRESDPERGRFAASTNTHTS